MNMVKASRPKWKHLLGLSAIAFLCPILLKAQDETAGVSGITKDQAGHPVGGVTVTAIYPGKNFRTNKLSDSTGVFKFTKLPAGGPYHFTFTSVGYAAAAMSGYTLKPGSLISLVVRLTETSSGLNEVVVVGYGSQKKMNVTGAVDQISGKELANRPIANVFQGLQGLSPGLNITYSGGKPGVAPSFNVRGFTSISNSGQNYDPLVVIDGIASTTADLMRINPADVASFTVLRDAASAAIYGARASYGVVIVTTKQGSGKPVISYNNYFSSSRPTVLPQPITDPYIYARILETSTDNTPWQYIKFTDDQFQWAKNRSDDPSLPDTRLKPTDPTQWDYMGNNNWYNYFLNKTSFSQNHSISISGATETTKQQPFGYYLSANYTKENGLNKLARDDWNRYALKARMNFMPLKWLKLDNNLNLYQTKSTIPSAALTDLYYLKPIDVARNPDGTWANTGAGQFAASQVNGGNSVSGMFGFQNIGSVVGIFLHGDLQITADASIKRESNKADTVHTPYSIGYGPNDVRSTGGTGSVLETNSTISDDVFDVFANYNKRIGDHGIRILLGYNQESYTNPAVTSERDGLISAGLPYLGLTTGTNFVTPDYHSFATRSYFGRIGYSYKDRYILEGNGRYDGSSRFPSSHRWGFFPSVSGAWIASKEPFLDAMTNYIPTLKFRASYGSLGNQYGSSPNQGNFDYLQTLPTGLSNSLINGNLQTVIRNAPGLSIDPRTYTWEKVTTRNFGADIGLMKDKVQLSFDYFVRNTSGMLVPGQPVPNALGTAVPRQNSADESTKGFEFSASYRNVYKVASKPFSLNARFTLSDSRARITRFNNPLKLFKDQNGKSTYYEGQQIGEIWGLKSNGLFQNAGEIAKLDESAIVPWGALSIVNGWPKYADMDGNAKIEQGISAKDPKDLRIIGNSSPRFRFGFNLDMNWNGLDASIFLQGVAKMDYYPHHYLFWGPFQQPYAGLYPWNLNFYRGTSETAQQKAQNSKSYNALGLADANLNSRYPVLQSWLADHNYGSGLDIPQTGYMLNAAYLRIKNVTIGYTLPAILTQRYKINRLRVYLSSENPFEFSKIKQYVDPEAVNATDAWAYPFQRKYALGLNLDF
ncbi:SusC/RagA family TonB-linked outer membrane protein [Flavitalea flava]